jgi:hypothetical protein
MMRVRLNGWQRIGVVLSLIWVAVGWVLGANELTYEASFQYRELPLENEINDTHRDTCTAQAATAFKWCNASSKLASEACGPSGAREPGCEVIDPACEGELKSANQICMANYWQDYHASMKNAAEYFDKTRSDHWLVMPIYALAPLPFAWLIVYALIGLWRWITRGFNT